MSKLKSATKKSKLQPRKRFIMKYLYRSLFVLGIICYVFGIYFIWERNNPNRLAFKNYSGNIKIVKVVNPPVRIVIKDLNIDLPIYPAKIENGQWETTTLGASYLVSSPVPGQTGNSIIYAHDWVSLFGPLLDARQGEKVEIYYKDNSKKVFLIQKTLIVQYNQPGILEQTNDTRITLYTCTGFLDSERMVAVSEYRMN